MSTTDELSQSILAGLSKLQNHMPISPLVKVEDIDNLNTLLREADSAVWSAVEMIEGETD